ARYQEITCRSALNPVQGMPFNWTLNPYRGCTHGCHYCFARRYQTQFELGPGDDFSSLIFVKVNFPEVLRRELDKPSWMREQVALGTATDPYQPIEGHYKLTRRSLEALIAGRTPVGIVTKGPMIVRDAGVLVAPVIPGFTTQTSKLDATIKAVADHGAAFMGANVLYLKGGTKDHFMGFLAHAFPHMVESYQRLYAGAYAPPEYIGTVRA